MLGAFTNLLNTMTGCSYQRYVVVVIQYGHQEGSQRSCSMYLSKLICHDHQGWHLSYLQSLLSHFGTDNTSQDLLTDHCCRHTYLITLYRSHNAVHFARP